MFKKMGLYEASSRQNGANCFQLLICFALFYVYLPYYFYMPYYMGFHISNYILSKFSAIKSFDTGKIQMLPSVELECYNLSKGKVFKYKS